MEKAPQISLRGLCGAWRIRTSGCAFGERHVGPLTPTPRSRPGTRTRTSFRSDAFEASMSANSNRRPSTRLLLVEDPSQPSSEDPRPSVLLCTAVALCPVKSQRGAIWKEDHEARLGLPDARPLLLQIGNDDLVALTGHDYSVPTPRRALQQAQWRREPRTMPTPAHRAERARWPAERMLPTEQHSLSSRPLSWPFSFPQSSKPPSS